jgi:hypothetical protein
MFLEFIVPRSSFLVPRSPLGGAGAGLSGARGWQGNIFNEDKDIPRAMQMCGLRPPPRGAAPSLSLGLAFRL